MSPKTPVLLLDVDGVVNAITKTPDPNVWESWQKGEAESNGRTWPITWSPEVAKYLTGLHDSGRVEIRWHTTWQEDAQRIADLVALPTLPVADAPEYAEGGRFAARMIRENRPKWWKLPAAERVVAEEGRPLIWIDDDIADKLWREGGMAYPIGTVDAPALLVCPNERTGLAPKHLRTIDSFLTELEEGRK
jgi:hypothetical protein